eukprot:3441839-Ditylum_brightwellii.AAC.1
MAAVSYVGQYALSTLTQGITFLSDHQFSLTSFLNTHLTEDHLAAFCDANWDPQDQSQSSPATEILLEKLHFMPGHVILQNGSRCPGAVSYTHLTLPTN